MTRTDYFSLFLATGNGVPRHLLTDSSPWEEQKCETLWESNVLVVRHAVSHQRENPNDLVLVVLPRNYARADGSGNEVVRKGFEVGRVSEDTVTAFRFYETDDVHEAASNYETDLYCTPLCDASCGGVCY